MYIRLIQGYTERRIIMYVYLLFNLILCFRSQSVILHVVSIFHHACNITFSQSYKVFTEQENIRRSWTKAGSMTRRRSIPGTATRPWSPLPPDTASPPTLTSSLPSWSWSRERRHFQPKIKYYGSKQHRNVFDIFHHTLAIGKPSCLIWTWHNSNPSAKFMFACRLMKK